MSRRRLYGMTANINYEFATELIDTEPLYTNSGGSGDRRGIMDVYDDGALFNGIYKTRKLIDGITTDSNAIYINASAVANKRCVFDFKISKRVVGFKFYQTTNVAQGNYDFQGSSDNSSWTTITNVNLATGEFLFTNTNSYRYYRLNGVSGNGNSGPYSNEFEFKIMGSSYIDTTTYTDLYSTGDRTGIISITTDLSYLGSTLPTLVNGTTTSGNFYFSGTSVVGKYIQFTLNAPKIFTAIKMYQTTNVSQGVYDIQGSDDNVNWITLCTNVDLGIEQEAKFPNKRSYKYYRLFGKNGFTNIGPFIYELEFKAY